MIENKKTKIKSICISEIRGIQKHPIEKAILKKDYGIVGDAHAGDWHRQVSLLSYASVKKMENKLGYKINEGAFAENLLLDEGICLYELPIGTKIKINDALLEVTQIGKECHQDCEIRKKTGECVMPKEGIFAKVLEGGEIKKGDLVEVME